MSVGLVATKVEFFIHWLLRKREKSGRISKIISSGTEMPYVTQLFSTVMQEKTVGQAPSAHGVFYKIKADKKLYFFIH